MRKEQRSGETEKDLLEQRPKGTPNQFGKRGNLICTSNLR